MNDIQNVVTSNTPGVPKPKSKRRFKKVIVTDTSKFPGLINTPAKVEIGDSYFIFFNVPVTAPIGTSLEAGNVHNFASHLDTQAKAKGVGAVTSVGVNGGIFEVVLKLATTGDQIIPEKPAENAFEQLKDYLSTATVLTTGPVGKPATWKGKANGTTILEGHY